MPLVVVSSLLPAIPVNNNNINNNSSNIVEVQLEIQSLTSCAQEINSLRCVSRYCTAHVLGSLLFREAFVVNNVPHS